MITVTDLFCGAGGSGLGATAVAGVRLVMAANHSPLAIRTHQANFPDTDHDVADISQVEPRRYPRGHHVAGSRRVNGPMFLLGTRIGRSAVKTARLPLAATRTGTDWCPSCELEAGTNRFHDQATGRERCASCAAGLVATPPGAHRVLITGSRTWTAITAMRAELARWRQVYPHAVLVHGACHGADQTAAAIWSGWHLPVEPHPADWTTHGRAAGLLRNQVMVELGATVCVAFIHDHSRGATHCADLAQAAGIPTYRYRQEASRS